MLAELRPDVAFNALHGSWGEDGRMPAILETLQIPYTHSGVLRLGHRHGQGKVEEIFRRAGLPVAESRVVDIEPRRRSIP